MALSPAFTCCTACPPVMAESVCTYGSLVSSFHSFSAPCRASVCSTCTVPRRRQTSSAEQGRVMPAQRGVFHSRVRSATNVRLSMAAPSVKVLVGDQCQEFREFGASHHLLEQLRGQREFRTALDVLDLFGDRAAHQLLRHGPAVVQF